MRRTKTLTIEEIKNIIVSHKEELRKKYGVAEIGIFGSVLRGENNRRSDLDILVELEENHNTGLLAFINMENYLSDLLGMKVDLVEKTSLKPRIGRHILKEVQFL